MRVVALFRVSTEGQASEGASLDAQQRIYREMAAKHGWQTVGEFRGYESGTQAISDRRVLQQVLTCVRDNNPDAVYVHEQSRLTRGDELEVALLMRELKERRLKIIVNGTVRDLASIDERFMVGIQSLVDRAESERIKERMGRGKRERARQGKKNSGPAPYGFENPLPGVAGRGTLQIVEAEAVVVRRIFTMFAQGKGKLTIAKALNESGVPSPKGREWGGTTVARLVQNPAYVGVAAANVWVAERGSRTFRFQPNNPNAIMIEGAYPAIVDKALWDAVHKRTKQPRTNRPRMLSGLLYINGRKAGGDTVKKTAWYVDAARKPGCPWLRVDEVDAAVWERFAALATGPEFVEKLLREAQDPRQQELARMEVEWLTSEITKAERRLERLVGMRADDEIDKPTFAARSRETRTSIEEWKRQLVEQQAKAAVLDSTHADRIVAAVRTMLAGRTRLTTEQKRQLLASIVRRVDVTAQKAATRHVRGEGGRILPGEVPQWETKAVGFQLALPSEAVQPELAIETARRSGSAGSVVLPVSESDFVAGEVFSCAPSCPVTAST